MNKLFDHLFKDIEKKEEINMKPNVYSHKHRHIDGPIGQIARDCKYKWIIVISYAIANVRKALEEF